VADEDLRRGPLPRRGTPWEHSSARVLIWLGILAVAFGYIEAAVAHYLRMHLYPGGFHDSVVLVADAHTVGVEAGRELCTLVLIIAAAALTPGPLVRRVANFVYVFAIWDLSYYAALWLFEGWPSSLFDWDLLFVIPVPWFAPVLAPIVISCVGIIGACCVHVILDRRGELVVPWHGFALVNGALMAWEISFMLHDGPLDRFPAQYRWWLFLLGIVLAGVGFASTWYQNRPSRVSEPRRESRVRRAWHLRRFSRSRRRAFRGGM
jgi:hypothetical protein